MASRPIFMAKEGQPGVRVEAVTFEWFPGLSVSQAQKSVEALHAAACEAQPGLQPLEASTRSREPLGVALSAFNLCSKRAACVESVYQCSKVFTTGEGPWPEKYALSGKAARAFLHTLVDSAPKRLSHFNVAGTRWALDPKLAFYTWVYCSILHQNPTLVAQLMAYNAFTDIAYNPKRSLNTQAYALAYYQSLVQCKCVHTLKSQADFLAIFPTDVPEEMSPTLRPKMRKRKAQVAKTTSREGELFATR